MKHVHLVGIGGAGMSAIARVLHGRGFRVSGSDRALNPITAALAAEGVTIYEGHAATHVEGAELVLISSAVQPDNPEVSAARAAGIEVLKRREALPFVLEGKTQIAVAGTHGKTTTTALITHLLREVGRDPSYIVGGVMQNTGNNAHAGTGDAFVIEADEYDHMFLGLMPTIGVITNIEHDHPDMFPTFDDTLRAFEGFVGRIPDYDGVLIACADDSGAMRIAKPRRGRGQPTLTYGIHSPEANWQASETADGLVIQGMENGELLEVTLQKALPPALVGAHMRQNMLAALAACVAYGASLTAMMPALLSFKGTGRRLEQMGVYRGVPILSDYGHHPTAIRTTLEAVRQLYPEAAVWAVWQPHTYSRTRTLLGDFAEAFAAADHALITTIYPSRERYQTGDPDGNSIEAAVRGTHHPDVRYSGDLAATALLLRRELTVGAVVIIFSAGDAPKIGEMLLAEGG